jgi:hypothetical protein
MLLKDSLSEIIEKDPIISTFSADDLVKNPGFVESIYSKHAETHMSLGDTAEYQNNLIKWIVTNKGSVTGAIVGEYGYGKTSTAVYLWKKCQGNEIIAVPPFEWYSLEDLIKGVHGWVRYKLKNAAPDFALESDTLYHGYEKTALDNIAIERGISVKDLMNLQKDGLLKLEITPAEVLDYISELTDIVVKAKFKGIIIFTDELQGTSEAYPSQKKFLDDMFNLVNELLKREGNYGIIFCMPLGTETMIADVRKDIIDRLKKRNLYMRCEDIYDRGFPGTLWDKYADLFEFEDHKFDIVEPETLDAIGQIASRRDLGAGPRSVIQAFAQISNHYFDLEKPYTPVDLIDGYLSKKMSFATGSKLLRVVKDELDTDIVKKDDRNVYAIKLLAAFPQYGCSDEIIQKYGLKGVIGKLAGTDIIKLQEGYTLLKLQSETAPKTLVHERLIRDFIQRYVEDSEHAEMACAAFADYIFTDIFSRPHTGTPPIEAWTIIHNKQIKNGVQLCLTGSFNSKYPYRNVLATITTENPDISNDTNEIGIWFYLDYTKPPTDPGEVRYVSPATVVFRLNLLCQSNKQLRLPYFNLLPSEKLSPMFMLSLLWDLNMNIENIPKSEDISMAWIADTLVDSSIESLLGTSLQDHNDFELKIFGKQTIKEVFNEVCNKIYPHYKTLISSPPPHWQKKLSPHTQALKDDRIPIGVKRGKKWYESDKDVIQSIFGISSKLSVQTTMDTLSDLIEYEWGGKDDPTAKMLFKMHPFENVILEQLQKSEKMVESDNVYAHFLSKDVVIDKGTQLGYTEDEIDVCINFLELRKYVTFDPKDGNLKESIASIEDMRDALQETVAKAQELLETIDNTSGIFDKETYESKIQVVGGRTDSIQDIEEYEELQRDISGIISKLNGSIDHTKGVMDADLAKISAKINVTITKGIPPELEPKKAGVSWIDDFNQCQTILDNKYKVVINNLKKSRAATKELQGKIASAIDEKEFQTIYGEYIVIKQDVEDYCKELESAKLYLNNYIKWDEVLNEATRTHQEANQLKETYENSMFIDELKGCFTNISSDLNSRKLEALADHEFHLKNVKDVKTKISDWLRTQRTSFMEQKEKYESDLSELEIGKDKLRVNFDPFNPEGSFNDLFDEVKEKTSEHLSETTSKVKMLKTQLLSDSLIHKIDVKKPLEDIETITGEFSTIQDTLSIKNIKNDEEWSLIVGRIKKSNEYFNEIDAGSEPTKKLPPSDDEKIILDIVSDDSMGTDLSGIISKLVDKEGENLDLKTLMEHLQNLFRKNHIIIKILPRR